MYISHVLLKFISKREYVEDFLNGDFYMNTLFTFWNKKPLEDAQKKKEAYIEAHPEENPDNIFVKIQNTLYRSQSDMLEGVVGYSSNARFKPYVRRAYAFGLYLSGSWFSILQRPMLL